MNEEREITREELYKLVWSKSLVLAAQELGISDVRLAKICKRLDVPRPYRGYWARLESGHKPRIPPLPAAKKDTPESAFVSPNFKRQPLPDDEARTLTETESIPANQIVVADDLRSAHPLVRETRKRLERKWVDPYGRIYPGWSPNESQRQIIDINVYQGTVHRAFRIMDALIKAIETRGGQIEIKDRKTYCYLNEAKVQFSLWEKMTRTEREVSEKERRESYSSDRWIFTPTGKLTLRIDEHYVGRSSWRDKPTKPLEKQLNDVMVGLITASKIIHERDLEWERKRQRELEEQQRRAELARLQQIERARREQLNRLVDSWKRSLNLRQFLAECKKALTDGEGLQPQSSQARWLEWATAYADNLNPLTNGRLNTVINDWSQPSLESERLK